MFDTNGECWLIEFTKGPALRYSPEHMLNLHKDIVNEALGMMFEINTKRLNDQSWQSQGACWSHLFRGWQPPIQHAGRWPPHACKELHA